ncbi:MAG: caspase family protein [Lewinellaceae bacterium]|nr:caspase family protein [Lewinellaceae bacterium]
MRKTILFLLLLFCLPFLAMVLDQSETAVPTLRPGKDYALFFANDDYRSHPDFGNLKNPVKDARVIARELKEMYGFEEAPVYENYSRGQIYQVLEQWQKRSFPADGQLFIFFGSRFSGSFRTAAAHLCHLHHGDVPEQRPGTARPAVCHHSPGAAGEPEFSVHCLRPVPALRPCPLFRHRPAGAGHPGAIRLHD